MDCKGCLKSDFEAKMFRFSWADVEAVGNSSKNPYYLMCNNFPSWFRMAWET